MTTENWIAIAAALIAFGSFIASAWQAHLAHKSQKSSAESAKRSLNASESASKSQERIAAVLEKMESKYSIPWEVEHFKGATYTLRNASDEEALDVKFGTDSPVNVGETHTYERLAPGDVVSFMYAADMNCGYRIVVEWRRPSETEPRVWNGRVPPKSRS